MLYQAKRLRCSRRSKTAARGPCRGGPQWRRTLLLGASRRFPPRCPRWGRLLGKQLFLPRKSWLEKIFGIFRSRPLAIYFGPEYHCKCCGRITVIHPHHASFRKRAATDLVRDSIRQVVDWLRPVFSGSNALEEVVSDSGVFPFWKMQTLRSE